MSLNLKSNGYSKAKIVVDDIVMIAVCRVFEYIRVFRCFKCGGFDHKAEGCKTGRRCQKCAESDHVAENCKSEVLVCGNCVQANIDYRMDLKTDHSIFDLSCTCLQRKISLEKRKIKYNVENA